jgi:hypothetical protein
LSTSNFSYTRMQSETNLGTVTKINNVDVELN